MAFPNGTLDSDLVVTAPPPCGDAIASIYTSINKKDKYVLEADIHKFFDQVNHEDGNSKLSHE